MKLLNDFFKIAKREVTDNGLCFDIVLNQEHFIYKAHFPNNPITPGVCITQMATEILEEESGRKLQLTEISNIKYLSILSPLEHRCVKMEFSNLTNEETGRKAKIILYDNSTQFAKISMTCNYEQR